jgi:hypothetical protein
MTRGQGRLGKNEQGIATAIEAKKSVNRRWGGGGGVGLGGGGGQVSVEGGG